MGGRRGGGFQDALLTGQKKRSGEESSMLICVRDVTPLRDVLAANQHAAFCFLTIASLFTCFFWSRRDRSQAGKTRDPWSKLPVLPMRISRNF